MTSIKIPKIARTDKRGFKAFIMMFRRFNHYFGYSSRAEFWWGFLYIVISSMILITFALFALILPSPVDMIILGIILIMGVTLVLGYLSLLMRRLGDAKLSRIFALFIFSLIIPFDMASLSALRIGLPEIIGIIVNIGVLLLCIRETKVTIIKQ